MFAVVAAQRFYSISRLSQQFLRMELLSKASQQISHRLDETYSVYIYHSEDLNDFGDVF